MKVKNLYLPWIGAIDQGTTSSRFFVFDNRGVIVASCQQKIQLKTTHEKYIIFTSALNISFVEQDADEILGSVKQCIEKVSGFIMSKFGFDLRNKISCIGITNQRETFVAWNSKTMKPLYPAIGWMDGRTKERLKQFKDSQKTIRDISGLPISTYFSSSKINWLLRKFKKEVQNDHQLRIGTIDCWLLNNLIGKHVTDASNAQRTQLLDYKTLEWSQELLNLFSVPRQSLPKVLNSDSFFGNIMKGPLEEVPITGVSGDQNAAMVGQSCFEKASVKCTFGTGIFLMCNMGTICPKNDGKTELLNTLAYIKDNQVFYALEASIPSAGVAIEWLSKNLEFFQNPQELDDLCEKDNGGVFFVPSLQGHFSPRWNPDAKASFAGLSLSTNKRHMCRSVVEAMAFSVKECVDICNEYLHTEIKELNVDGGLTNSRILMQCLADACQIPIKISSHKEATIFGAAKTAAFGLGLGDWPSQENLSMRSKVKIILPKSDIQLQFQRWKSIVDHMNKIKV